MSAYTIRAAVPDDAPALLAHIRALLSEPGVFLVTRPHEFMMTEDDERAYIQQMQSRANSRIVLAFDRADALIGEINLRGGVREAEYHAALLGISIAHGWRNRGVGRALITTALRWAKDTGVVKRVYLHVLDANQGAIHLYESCGFVHEGRQHRAIYRDGRYYDSLMMGVWLDDLDR